MTQPDHLGTSKPDLRSFDSVPVDTFSPSGDNSCVGLQLTSAGVRVSDTKDPDGAGLLFSPHEWGAFIAGIRAGGGALPTA